ncbi:MAG: DUF72 domain-containing protein [Spirochaetaceae bacterium]|nr:MAG: DUF72 domain-containing protein [Spirochaetaceae bacterium]
MAEIYIGTSGYSYKDWKGLFYPENAADSDFLSFYSAHFPFVELNFSYYTMPKAVLVEKLVEKTCSNFRFAIKAHKSLTHEITDDTKRVAAAFREGIAPLSNSNRLAVVLVQFPYSFHYTPENRKHLASLCDLLEDLPLAVEFRSVEWTTEHVVAELEKRRVAIVNVDEPDLPKLIPPSAHVTAEAAYIRFHGRNKANWWQGDNVSRYDYLYQDDELAGWVGRVKSIIEKARVLFVSFNNHAKAQAVANAKCFAQMLILNDVKGVVLPGDTATAG